jgi:hypothetical protein
LNLTERLQTSLSEIARERDPYMATGGHFFVQEYIREQFSQWGSVEIHTFRVRGKACKNFILNLQSQEGFKPRPLWAIDIFGGRFKPHPLWVAHPPASCLLPPASLTLRS